MNFREVNAAIGTGMNWFKVWINGML